MNGALGQGGVLLALLSAAFGIVTLVIGLVQKRAALLRTGHVYVWLVLLGAVVAVVAMQRALLTDDFSLVYTAENHSRSTPTLFKVSTMWSALEGSILLWGLVLAGYLAAMTWRFRARRADPIVTWATVTGLVVAVFFFGLMVGPANPFTLVAGAVPADGPGPNPLLQNHPLVAFHPPLLYLGYVGFTVPFAFAIAALVTGRLGEGWLVETRRWTLAAWGFLTGGILLGAWWSYEVLGWGGYWAWDPVENASFLPWLTGTAYLHSVIVQERRGMLRVWNLSLLLATFALTILGTFITRSGVLDSVHAFTESGIGPAILGFFALVVFAGLGLIAWRGDRMHAPGSIDSPVSREAAFLGNNLLFGLFALVVLLGTVFPLIVEAVNGDRISVGRPYFDQMTTPIGLALLFLMAVAPLLPWRKASTPLLHDRLLVPAWVGVAAVVVAVALGGTGLTPLVAFGLGGFAGGAAVRQLVAAVRRNGLGGFVGRTNGGMVVHVGVVIIAIALTASSSYASRGEFRLEPGESASIAGHRITYLGVDTEEHPNRTATVAAVRVDGGAVYRPALSTFPFATQAIGTPSVSTTVAGDVYLTLVRTPESTDGRATIGVIVQPLVVWLWIGGGVMALGTALALLPTGSERRVRSGAGQPDLPQVEETLAPEGSVVEVGR